MQTAPAGTQSSLHHTLGATSSHRLEGQQLLLANNAAFIAPKLTSPCDQHRFLPPCHTRQSPSVPVVSTTFPKQKPSQLAGSLGQLPLPRAWGEHPLPAPLPAPRWHWEDLASAGPSWPWLWAVEPRNKSTHRHGGVTY